MWWLLLNLSQRHKPRCLKNDKRWCNDCMTVKTREYGLYWWISLWFNVVRSKRDERMFACCLKRENRRMDVAVHCVVSMFWHVVIFDMCPCEWSSMNDRVVVILIACNWNRHLSSSAIPQYKRCDDYYWIYHNGISRDVWRMIKDDAMIAWLLKWENMGCMRWHDAWLIIDIKINKRYKYTRRFSAPFPFNCPKGGVRGQRH
jgi:hypothetical protein